ncbi:MAG: winged helix-turn-helix transcriptional regulator [Candidatus Aminicenantes bacterium]|nr:winged helix-turn-helix transcriptional regulator [Candidatus Aminicenantes bacterium]
MINEVRFLKALADENRLRLLMLLAQKELFVCQLMAVTGLSQSLVSRSLALLEREGLVESRRQGKHVFYSLKKELPDLGRVIMKNLSGQRGKAAPFASDRGNLELFCKRFQRGSACDMSMVQEFIAYKNQQQ